MTPHLKIRKGEFWLILLKMCTRKIQVSILYIEYSVYICTNKEVLLFKPCVCLLKSFKHQHLAFKKYLNRIIL